MVYKSFMRKKTSIIYFLIYILLFLGLGLLIITQHNYVQKENDFYKYAKMIVKTDKTGIFKEVKNIESFDKVVEVKLGQENLNSYLISNNQLKEDQVLVSLQKQEEIKAGQIIKGNYQSQSLELKVVGYSDKVFGDYFLVSEEFIKELEKVKVSNLYSLNLNNWFQKQKVLDQLNKIGENEEIDIQLYMGNTNGRDYGDAYFRIWIFLVLLICAFGVINIFTILNIIEGEKNNNHLYKVLGYRRVKIIFMMIKKLLLLITGALLFSLTVLFVVAKIII